MYTAIIVEDEDIIRSGIRHSVPWEQSMVTIVGEARNGEEGIALIEELNPDIVVTDINMPIVDGLKMIAQTKYRYDYVAIILTGYSDFQYAREAIKNGVSDYVMKPLCIGEMQEALERAVLECRNIRILRRRNETVQELRSISLLTEDVDKEQLDPVAEQIMDYITRNYASKITLADFEEALHYSERHMNQRFQKAMGTTIIEYLNRYRIQKALAMLCQLKDFSITDIAASCGIGDYKYFNQVFRKYMGCSPKEYRINISG
ncbi:helix-turn-helix domain-containing protein [Hydrogenoanaerobacterium sp.]|uniref:response regulator transcription factor n=1 Tax=Hydrogenoanaerobacterium sp. TaxID=2953763 RepID=UPI00289F47FC|nr:helix-turn-helix domain-containing protein [Hydrogenoanaerobacterium sp.]